MTHDNGAYVKDYTYPCAVCGTTCGPKERHTFLDCLRANWRAGRLTQKDMAALFRYAEKGEQAWEAERETTNAR